MSLSLLPVLQSIRWPCSAVIPPLRFTTSTATRATRS
jgi:hypothetical protein